MARSTASSLALVTAALLGCSSAGSGGVSGGITVAQFQDTFASMMGKTVEVEGVYMNSNTSECGGKTTYSLVVVETKGQVKPSVSCYTDKEVTALEQYDRVVVSGTVAKGFEGELRDCKVIR